MQTLHNALPFASTLGNNLSYWIKKLEGISFLEIPVDYVRPAVRSNRKAKIEFTIDKALFGKLQQLSYQQEVTLSMTLLSGFKVLLHRYSHQQDICVGVPIVTRYGKEEGPLVDFFVNVLILRSEVNSDTGFIEFLQQVKFTALEAYKNQEVPYEKVVKAVVKEKDFSRNPLSQAMFIMQNDHELSRLELAEGRVPAENDESDTSKFDLTLVIAETVLGFKCSLAYYRELFSEQTIVRMIGHYKELLASIIKHPYQKIGVLPILSEAEKYQLLVEFNNTAVEYPKDKTIIDLFEEQAAKTPEATAIVFEEQQLTYKELNDRANQLGHYLRGKGIKEETLVPICIERSVEMIIGILGVMKSGGAYVPIDPQYPLERLQYILEDIRASVVVSSKKSRATLPATMALDIIEVNEDWFATGSQPWGEVQTSLKSAHLAYVIYTSGSTGKPKGVMVEHKSVVNLLMSIADKVEFKSNSSFLSVTTCSFDICYLELFMPLIFGGKLIIVHKDVVIDGFRLAEKITLYSPSHMQATPVTWELLLAGGWKNKNGIKLLIGGEAVKESLKDELTMWGSVFNVYGPTETTIWSTIKKLQPDQKVSIGRPIANTCIYLLDKYDQPCPIGVTGEICIGGAGLARGYLNREELTKEKFVANSFSKLAGARMYRTGDLGRWLADGNIECHGRIDYQVKIRGYRIELGEIESALSQHPAVQEIIVMAREDSPHDKCLVAYIVPSREHAPTSSDLRCFLNEKLPEYMVPSMFVFLKALPLTFNRKIDRSALPVPDQTRPETGETLVAPRSALELKLQKIWQECLKIQLIGVQDNFFELGGNSIQAAQMFSQIRKIIGKPLPIAILFQAPTISQLAIIISEEGAAAPWTSLVSIQPNGNKTPLFFMHAGAGTVLLYRSLSQCLGPDQPFYGLQAKGLNGNESPHSCIEDMAAHYLKEICVVQPEGPYLLGGYCLGGTLAFEMAQQLTGQGHSVALLASMNGVSPIYAGPSNLPDKDEEENLRDNSLTVANEVEDQWKKFLHSSSKEKIIFLIKKITSYQQRSKIRKLIYKYYLFRHLPMPEVLGKTYFLETNDDIAKAYKPQPYPGKMLILRSPAIYPDPHLGWDGLVLGGIETHDIPGEHQNRREILNEPFVRYTAKELTNYLEG